jgi:hypothetical protein
MWDHIFFEFDDQQHTCPVQQWLDGQPARVRAKLLWILKEHIRPNGLNTRGDILHHVNKKEFYQITWLDKYRVLMYHPPKSQLLVLLHAFIKKTRETEEAHLNVARNYRDKYISISSKG